MFDRKNPLLPSRRALLSGAAAAFCGLPFATARGQDRQPGSNVALPARAETQHTLAIAPRPIEYHAIVETIGLTNEKGEPTATIATISYLAEPVPGIRRPVAFVFNGGPGAAAVFLHMGALGPRIIDSPPNGAMPVPPVRLVDNPESWLRFTDLVFVDPVGTGFSHGEGKGDNPDEPFWNVEADLNSLGAAVRRWLTRHQRWNDPLYLVGESYGGLRAAALSRSLARDLGITARGLVLVSPALDIALLHPDIADMMASAFELPTCAASAAVLAGNSALDPGVVERFALSDYIVGLAGLRGIPAAGDPFITRLAELTGLPERIVRAERGRVSGETFVHELRRDRGEILSQYDATVTRPTTANPWDDRAGDAILGPAVAAFTTGFEAYLADTLEYRTERPYHVLSRQVSQHWKWDGARGGEGGLGLALSSLQETLLARPQTRVLIVNGRYDLVTPYFASRWLVDQLAIPAAVRSAISLRVYEGGHMMYTRPQSRGALAADAAQVFAASPAAPPQ